MTPLLADLRFALRGFFRTPLFTVVAILSLSLGIGANTAIFTLLDQMLLRRLPIRAPDELVMLFQRGDHMGSNMGSRAHSYPIYQDFQKRAEPLAQVAARRLVPASVAIDNRTERVGAELVSGNYFSMLGVKPAIGRVFNSKEDDQVYQGHPVVVLGYDYWTMRFANDPGVVGRKILVNNYPMTIVGVSARGFSGMDPAQATQIRVPILMMPVLMPEWTWLQIDDRRARWVQVFARLKPSYTAESAAGPDAGPLPPDPRVRNDAACGEGMVRLLARAVHEGHAARRARGHGLLGASQRLFDRAHRADVHGGPGAAHRVRQCRESAHCAGIHAPEGDRGAPVARRVARPAGPTASRREPDALARRRPRRRLSRRGPDAGPPLARAVRRKPPARPGVARSANHGLRDRAHLPDGSRLRAAAGAAREPSGPLRHAQGHDGVDRPVRRIALPAQGPRHDPGRVELPAALRCRSLRAQPAEPEGHRYGRRARQSRDVSALAGAQRLRQRARRAVLSGPARAAENRARHHVGGHGQRTDPERRRVG